MATGRRKRDYAAEERRRNELARQRGFTSRAAQRGAQRRGEIRLVRKGRGPARVVARKRPSDKITQRYGSFTFRTTKSQTAADWSIYGAQTDMARYNPGDASTYGMTREAYTDLYYKAWAQRDLAAKRRWLVGLGFMTPEVFDKKYPMESHDIETAKSEGWNQ